MKEQELEYLRSPALGTVVKSALLGFVLGEFFYVFFEFGKSIRDRFSHSSSLLEIVLFEGALYTSLIVFSVLRYLRPAFARGIRSKRVDLLIGVALGCLGAIAFPNPVSVQYQSFFDSLTSFQIGITFAISRRG